MEFSYELTPEEWRRTSIACLHLGPLWPALKWARALTATIAIAGLLATFGCWSLWGSWIGAGCAASVGLIGVFGRVLLSDRLRAGRDAPPDAIAQGLSLTEEGLLDLIRSTGEPELFPWSRVSHLVDARWGWLIGVGNDEWLVLPIRVLSDELRESVAEELTSRTGQSFVPLP